MYERCSGCGKWGLIVFHNRFRLLLCQRCLERHLMQLLDRAGGRLKAVEDEEPTKKVEHPLIPRTIELSPGGARVRLDGQVSRFIVIKGQRYEICTHPNGHKQSVTDKNGKAGHGHDAGG